MFVMCETLLPWCEKLNTSVSRLSFVYFPKKLVLCTRCSCSAWSFAPNAFALEELLPTFKQGIGI